jgi:hypothetical protein
MKAVQPLSTAAEFFPSIITIGFSSWFQDVLIAWIVFHWTKSNSARTVFQILPNNTPRDRVFDFARSIMMSQSWFENFYVETALSEWVIVFQAIKETQLVLRDIIYRVWRFPHLDPGDHWTNTLLSYLEPKLRKCWFMLQFFKITQSICTSLSEVLQKGHFSSFPKYSRRGIRFQTHVNRRDSISRGEMDSFHFDWAKGDRKYDSHSQTKWIWVCCLSV